MRKALTSILAVSVLALGGCANRIVGDSPNQGVYGMAAAHNERVQIAYGDPVEKLRALSAAFQAAAPDTVTFEFNRSSLDATAKRALDQQIAWLKENEGVRVAVVGNTDLVGSESYNQRLGLARARTVARYLTSHGVSRKRIDEVVSHGESDPVVPTEERERRNRRAETQVVGFDFGYVGNGLDGVYAARVYDRYQAGGISVQEGSVDTGG